MGSVINRLTVGLSAALSLTAFPAMAVDFSASGFGTVGYARSDESFVYQRFIDNSGTLRRDSVFGVQVDAQLSHQLAATVQIKAAPSLKDDNKVGGTVQWAFLSYRPTNDLLLRAGKLRVPLYLYSENLDVGATYDFARLPTEMYSISPTTDFTGASVSKNWNLDSGEWTLDGYWGKANATQRLFSRDGILIPRGPRFVSTDVESAGLALALRREEDIYRVSVHSATAKFDNLPVTFPFVSLPSPPFPPGLGYYQTDNAIPGPGVPTVDQIKILVTTLGVNIGLGGDFRLISEYGQTKVKNSDLAPDSKRGYVSLLKRIGQWTPYITHAYLRSNRSRNLYKAVNDAAVPAFLPGAGLINAAQRAGADGIAAYDQSSWALGTSYSLSPTSKVKAEWMKVRIGDVSSMVDAPAGGNVRHTGFNVFSLSYNFVF